MRTHKIKREREMTKNSRQRTTTKQRNVTLCSQRRKETNEETLLKLTEFNEKAPIDL